MGPDWKKFVKARTSTQIISEVKNPTSISGELSSNTVSTDERRDTKAAEENRNRNALPSTGFATPVSSTQSSSGDADNSSKGKFYRLYYKDPHNVNGWLSERQTFELSQKSNEK